MSDVNWLTRAREMLWQPRAALFLRNFSIVFIFKILSLLLTLVVYIQCMRAFGIVVWADVALITSVAGILLIPLTFGLYNGIVKYVPISDEEESRTLMGTAFVGTLAISCGIAILFVIAGPFIEQFFGFSSTYWYWAIAVAMSINLYILSESFLRGQQRFFIIGSYKFYASIALLLATLVALHVLGARTPNVYLLSLIGYNLLFFFGAMWKSRIWPLTISIKAWRMLFSFGAFNMLSWLFSTILFTSDLLILARFGTKYDVGIYSVYQSNLRSLCTILFHDVFAVVFLPMIAAMDKRQMVRILFRFSPLLFVVLGMGVGVLTTILVMLFGKTIPLEWLYVLLTAAGVAMNLVYLLLTSVFALDGIKATRLVFGALIVPLPFLLGMQVLFVEQWGVIGGMASVIMLNALLIIVFQLVIRSKYPISLTDNKGAIDLIKRKESLS